MLSVSVFKCECECGCVCVARLQINASLKGVKIATGK